MNARNPNARIVVLLSVTSLVLAACGGDDAANDVTTTAPAATTTQAPTTTAEPPETTTTVAGTPGGDPELVWSFAYEDEGKIDSIAVAPNGETVVVTPPFAPAAYVHQLADGALLDVFVYRHHPQDLAFSPDGSLLAVGLGVLGVAVTTDDGSDPPGLEGLTRYGGFSGAHLHDGFDSVVAFSPDGRHLATGNRDGIVWLWRLTDGEQVAELEDPAGDWATSYAGDWVTSLDYHPSGNLLAATHFDCVVNIWDVDAASIIHTIDLTSINCYVVTRFAFSPDGTVMAAAVTEDWVTFVRVWNVDDATPIVDFSMDVDNFADLSFSPDGRMLATVASGTMAWPPPTVWDVSTATPLYTLESDRNPRPTAVSFTPDGGHVVVGYYDGTIELWRLPGAEPLVAPEREACEPLPLPGDVLFDTGSSALKASADPVLGELAADLGTRFPEATLTFVGHTDSRGAAGANMQLSVERAQAVQSWFEAWATANGVDGWVLSNEGRGDTELRVPDTDSDGNFLAEAGALNRRVEIEIEADACEP